ncbi:MAG: DUF2845 domain-containing protein [Sandaracinaceae bacterium]
MTCQNRIVRQGDAGSRVASLCGEPTQIVRRTVVRSRSVHRQLPNGTVVSDTVSFDVPVEEWTYDFGPQRFVRVVVIENGQVVQIQTHGYGTPPNTPR